MVKQGRMQRGSCSVGADAGILLLAAGSGRSPSLVWEGAELPSCPQLHCAVLRCALARVAGGEAATAHPHYDSNTGRLVGFSYQVSVPRCSKEGGFCPQAFLMLGGLWASATR